MSEAPTRLTLADLASCNMRETMHGHGDKGMWVYGFTCIEQPRLRKIEKCPKRGAPVEISFEVDGRAVGDTLEAVVEALNQPHDRAGCPGRLQERFSGRIKVSWLGGQLVAQGESAIRCERLNQSCPSFEGIPIQWLPAPATGQDGAA